MKHFTYDVLICATFCLFGLTRCGTDTKETHTLETKPCILVEEPSGEYELMLDAPMKCGKENERISAVQKVYSEQTGKLVAMRLVCTVLRCK